MIPLTAPISAAFASPRQAPIWVVEILFADGTHGVEGVNDIYFGSRPLEEVVGFPFPTRYWPLLDPHSLSGISSTLDAMTGVASIGSLTLRLLDLDRLVSRLIAAADAAGHGLRRQRIELYLLESGSDWADRVKMRTLQVENLRLAADGISYQLSAGDIQRTLKKKIFEPKSSILTAAITNSSTHIHVADASKFSLVTSSYYGAAGFAKIDDEIIMFTSINLVLNTLEIVTRGFFGTTAVHHDPSAGTGTAVTEVIVLRGNPIWIALAVLASSGTGINGPYDVLPAHWGCNMDPLDAWPDLNAVQWEDAGAMVAGFDAAAVVPMASGRQFQFVIAKGMEAKAFVEGEILRVLGMHSVINGNGSYGAAPFFDVAAATPGQALRILTLDDATAMPELDYSYPEIANDLTLYYDESPVLSGKFRRSTMFVDATSRAKWGVGKPLEVKSLGVIPTAEGIAALHQRLISMAARHSRPPIRLKLAAMPKHADLEVGDLVRVQLPLRDLHTGADLDRLFEVRATSLDVARGGVSLDLVAQPEAADLVALTQAWNATTTWKLADTVYQVGTQIDWSGLGGAQTVATGQSRTLTAGDWWVNGDLTADTGGTLIVQAGVRLFVRGVFTVRGQIDGRGRGNAGAIGLASAGWPALANGVAAAGRGFVGRGGSSANATVTREVFDWVSDGRVSVTYTAAGAASAAPIYAQSPIFALAPSSIDGVTNQWLGLIGLPTQSLAGGGGSSAAYAALSSGTAASGGAGGAGLFVLARGCDIDGASAASIDLSAMAGGSGAGGGGGGSFAILLERPVTGVQTDIFAASKINVAGTGGGTAGAIIHQVF